jgi:hypothetical protein
MVGDVVMRSEIHGPEIYLLRSKKPHIQKLIADAENMTADQVSQLNEKPDIIKGLLQLNKNKENQAAYERANKIADMMISAHLQKSNII